MANSIIEVSGLCKSYSSFQLQDISFSLAEGCIMGLIGENGAGKTTTLKALLDIVRPDSGEIRLFGQPVRSDSALLKEQIGVVWENSFSMRGLPLRMYSAVWPAFINNGIPYYTAGCWINSSCPFASLCRSFHAVCA